ncbi:NAD(P)H-dependent glycerol-3-phosphate dehydrogenase [Flavihumibacter sp. CACIAM 22H1]|uniref:NAD(P)H-dependent glycerol-3-phosphate dehydrogenase n=1 Tax=Flavihumibacter sp. CACIAM 22H1 TaxID=1812911 RepID=UPI0007A853E8|nr:NAD(P)H-dependent glycerol-3-phosphate dehydrogenase [Flavihumibacter sp. CACIAM 22H1]KYP15303.1 MAG: glycerol-3-phosphate dehydrogenase [Flavihumibacter sp. CACIAM 22H1]
MRLGIIGSGSWATALAKIVTDNGNTIHWLVRSEAIRQHLIQRKHNPNYLSSASFEINKLHLHTSITPLVESCDCLVVAVPSAYIIDTFKELPPGALEGKLVISAVKGMVPDKNILLNEWLQQQFNVPLSAYFTLMGPCHAEEVARERLSYLTFSGIDEALTVKLASYFKTWYINTIVNSDVLGVQYAAILKNIYALGAGIAHGLDYGDNFQSVFIANCADEMAAFLKKVGVQRMEVGSHQGADPVTHKKDANYAASVYLGDLLVTCYSLYSRNRTFGNMIGKGYSVISAQLEMNMVAEGYNASRSIEIINQSIQAEIPIASAIYRILWQQLSPAAGFDLIEEVLI